MPRNTSVSYFKYFFFIGLLASLSFSATPAVSQNPVGHWPFDEGTGSKTADATGGEHTASLVNGVKWIPGKFGGAVAANATDNQFVRIPAIDLSRTKAVTVALWSKRTYSLVGGHMLFENSTDYDLSTTGFALLPDDPTCHGVQASLRGDVGYVTNCYTQPSSGVWHHLALVFDKSQTGGNEVAFYVDGVLQTPARSLAASTNTNTFGNNPLYLFSRAGTLNFDTGTIADFRIYDSALTAEQIQQLYNGTGLLSLSVTPASVSLSSGDQRRFAAVGTYRDGSTRDLSHSVTWIATAPSVATVNGSGLALALAPGNTTIIAALARANGQATAVVTQPVGLRARDLGGPMVNTGSPAAITYVQGNSATPQSSPTTVNCTFTAAQAAGDLNVVVVGWNNSTSTVSSVTDSKGNVYARAVGPTVVSGALSQSIYYAKNIASANAGASTVTVKFSAATAYPDIRILEYQGADLNNPVDVVAANSGNSATSSSGSATTTSPTDLILGVNIVTTLTSGPGSGFTQRMLTSPDGDIAEDRTVTTTGSYSATAPLSSSGLWVMQMVAFRTPPDFTLAASPTSLSVAPGSQGTSTITTTVVGGFNNAITLSASGMPSGTTVSFSPNPIAAPGAGSSTMKIAVSSSTATGTYTLTVTGSGGGIQHTTTVTLTVTASANFTIAASPTSLSVAPGSQGTSTITTTVVGGFNNAITLSASGMPSGTTVSFSPNPIAAPGAGSSTMKIAVSSSTATGTYTLTVTGSGGGMQHTTTVTLTVTASANFTIAASPTSLSVAPGSQGTSTITTTVVGGFNNAITLSASGMPSGTTVSFSPNPIAAPGAGSSTMKIAVSSSTATGTYTLTVTGSGGGIQHTTTVTLTVTASANFTIAASPTSLSVAPGSQGTSTITTTVVGGFNNAITLSASGMPSGTTVSFSPNPIAAPGAGSSTMKIAVSSSTATGTYTLTVTGSGGGIQHTTTVTLTVTASANFTIAASPTSLSVAPGSQGTSTITTTVVGGFNNAITLSASGMPSGTTVSFSPNPIAAPGAGGSTMTVTVGSSTAAGTYPITVTGNGGGIQHTAAVTLTVTSTTISYVQGNYATPQTPQTTVSVTFNGAQAAADLNVVVVGWNDSSATVSSVVDSKRNPYVRAVGPTVVSGALSQSIYYAKNIASAAAGANTVTVSFSTAAVAPDIRILEYRGADLNSPVDVVAANSGNSATSSSGSATTTSATDLIFGANIVATLTSGPGTGFTSRMLTSPDGDIAEDQMVTTTGSYSASAPLSSAGPWIMQMVAFRTDPPALVSIAVSPTNASIVAAGQQQFTATGTYSDGSHQNLTNTATWTSSATSVATISTAGLATGIAQGSTTIQATSAQISGSATLTVTGPGDFTISASPASVSVRQGNQGSSTITTTISGGFSSSIPLSAAGAPSGTTVSFNPATIAAPGAGNSAITITVGSSTPAGTYPITVTGTGGGIQHSVTVTLTVTAAPNFTLSASPASLSVLHGNQGSSTLTTTISGGFSSSIALSASGAPTGTTVSFNPATIAAPGAGSSTITITVGSSTPTGTYAITVTGNGGGLVRTVTVSLTVTAQVALSWNASTSQGVVGYNAYRSTTSGGGYIKLNSSLIAATSYNDKTVQSRVTYYYVTTAVNSQGLESVYSNEAAATVP